MVHVAAGQYTLDEAVQDLRGKEGHGPGPGLDAPATKKLPGIAITKYVLHDIKENGWHTMGEPYLFGIAVDSSLTPVTIPWGLEANELKGKFALPKVAAEVEVKFGDKNGAPLILPPVQDFVAVTLMVADSDDAKATADVLKAVCDLVSNGDVLKVAAGLNPTASGILAVLGGLLNVTVAGIQHNRDDIIAAFSTYYGPSTLVPGKKLKLEQPGAEVWLRVMED